MLRLIKKRVGLYIFILLISCVCFGNINAFAASKDEGKCRTQLLNKMDIEYDAFSVDSGKNMTITVTVPNTGQYEVQYHITDYGDDAKDFQKSDITTETISGTTWTKNLSEGKEIFVFVTLKSDLTIESTTCHAAGTVSVNEAGSVTNKKSTWKSKYIQNPASSDVGNPVYDTTACAYMRQGHYKNNTNTSTYDVSEDDLNNWNRYAEKYFAYCYKTGTSMSFTLSQKNVNYIRKELLKIYKQKQNIKTGEIKVSPGFENAKKIDNPSNSDILNSLTCSVSPEKDEKGEYLDNDEKYYYEKVKKVNNDDNNQTVCTVTCREELEVIYGPPVAVKAGLCFQYEVTVKSKVQCKTQLNADAEPTPPTNFSAPVSICSAGSDQAGPNDDFDDCVTDCDGGKYSQSCINKCYNKVYKNSTSTSSNQKSTSTNSNNINLELLSDFDNNSSIELLANSDDDSDTIDYEIAGCKTNSQIWNNLDVCAQKLMEAKHQNPLGEYKDGNSQYDKANMHWAQDWDYVSHWESDAGKSSYRCRSGDCSAESYIESIKRAAPYFLRNLESTKDLIKGLRGYYSNGRYKRYVIRDDGIKRQYSSRYQCGEDCGFKGKSGTIYNNTEAEKAYKKSLEGYADALAKCNAVAECSTNTATFTIDVTNDRDTNNDNSCDTHDEKDEQYYHPWTATNTKNQPGGLPNGDTLIFTPVKGDSSDVNKGINGICYGKEMPWQHYKTTITFPGSWINLKTGEVEFVDPNKNNEYRTKENYFCTLYDSCNVNVDWWNWKINGTSLSNFNPTYNINSSIKDFGKYNWNISLQCFYALYNGTGPITSSKCYRGDPGTEELCSDTPEGSKDESTKLNYDIRVASLDNMFPNNRLRGYNWGAAAQLKADPNDSVLKQKLSENGYDINPVDYSREIIGSQNGKGEEKTYKETPDLIVNLSSDNISSLKQESLNFGGEFNKTKEIIPGLYAYEMKGFKDKYGITTNWTIGKNNG